MRIEGTILSAGRAQGLILGDDTKRYQFTPLGWSKPDAAPAAGMRVEFEPRGSHALDISPISGAPPPPIPAPSIATPTATGATLPDSPLRTVAPVASGVPPSPDPPASLGPSVQKQRTAPKKRSFLAGRMHWLLSGVAIVAIIGIVGGLFLFGVISLGGPPDGVEVERQTHQGDVYVLVEYGDELAIFDAQGSPVTQRGLAEAILWSYAWRQVLKEFDTTQLLDVSRRGG